MIRRVLLAVSHNQTIKHLATSAPGVSGVVTRFAAGVTTEDAVDATRELLDRGMSVTLDHLGEDTLDVAQASATTSAYRELLARLAEEGLAARAEVSVKLSAVGQALPGGGPSIATDNAFAICEAAAAAGTTVTLDMEDHTTTDLTLETLRSLRADFPWTGGVLQAYLRRTPGDCADLAYEGSRIRLCKGAYKEPESVAFVDREEVDRAYVRCLKILFQGQGHPMVATHDDRLVRIAEALVLRYGRRAEDYEFQMLYGVRPVEQRRLADAGHVLRVYVPYGTEWYGYLVRRMAERPANLVLGVRAILGQG
ncbi:MAG: proline dehydrogenase family protein [Actinomycetes bacterium]